MKESVRLLLQECECKKGCSNKRCSCFKAGVRCGPGCRCSNCEDVPSTRSLPDNNEVEQEELLSDHGVYNSELVEDIDGADTTADCEDNEENLSEERTISLS